MNQRRNSQFSVLAAVETLAATALSLLIAYAIDSFVHIIVGVVFAPFLLLRTKKSKATGLVLYRKFICNISGHYQYDKNNKIDDIKRFRYQTVIAFASLFIRAYATIISTVKCPLEAIKSISKNWYEQCFQINFRTPLEPVPGAKRFPEPSYNAVPTLSMWMKLITNIPVLIVILVSVMAVSLLGLASGLLVVLISALLGKLIDSDGVAVLVVGAIIAAVIAIKVSFKLVSYAPEIASKLPAVLYRWSLKSTFLFWAPLLWVLNPLPPRTTLTEEVLDEFRNGVISKLASLYSGILFLAFSGKLYLVGIANYSTNHPIVQATVIDIYLWHIAALLNALLAISLLVVSDIEIRKLKYRDGYIADKTVRILLITVVVRRFLTVYVLLNSFDILLALSGAIESFEFHGKLLAF
jgi:hypothetical protein